MIGRQDKYDLQWMEQITTKLGDRHHSNLENHLNATVTKFSLSLLCQYTKVLLVVPARLAACKHVYCVQKEVLEELGECPCGAFLKDSRLVEAGEVREVLDYLRDYQLQYREIMVLLNFKCFFPFAKDKVVYKPNRLLHQLLHKFCLKRQDWYHWNCPHRPQAAVNSEQVFSFLELLSCNCGLSGFELIPPPRIRIRID